MPANPKPLAGQVIVLTGASNGDRLVHRPAGGAAGRQAGARSTQHPDRGQLDGGHQVIRRPGHPCGGRRHGPRAGEGGGAGGDCAIRPHRHLDQQCRRRHLRPARRGERGRQPPPVRREFLGRRERLAGGLALPDRGAVARSSTWAPRSRKARVRCRACMPAPSRPSRALRMRCGQRCRKWTGSRGDHADPAERAGSAESRRSHHWRGDQEAAQAR